ncbi:hypothetical protein [Hydrogenimonas sp.]
MKALKRIALIALVSVGLAHAGSEFQIQKVDPVERLNGVEHIALNYGEISPRTGRPATNYVHGYMRSNGTYVNGYWRS